MGVADYKKKIKSLIRTAESEGWQVSHTSGGHWRFVPAERDRQIVHAAATSNDPRAIRNLEADLRRSGLAV